MSITRTPTIEQPPGAASGSGALPPLTTADRVALRVALARIIRTQHRSEAVDRIDATRRSRAAERVARHHHTTLQNRFQAGPTW